MSYSTYVISLADEYLRRDSIEKQLSKLDHDFNYVDATDMRFCDMSILEKYSALSEYSSVKRPLTRGEVGCALSHYNVYKRLLNSNDEWAWVIEDDAIVSRIKNNSIKKIINISSEKGADAIILGYSKLETKEEDSFYAMEPIKTIVGDSEITVGTPWKNWTCGTVSYLINKAGARKMLSILNENKIVTLADDWDFFCKKAGLKIFHCRPLLVFEDYNKFESSLENERVPNSKKKKKILNWIRIIRGSIRKGIMKYK